MTRVFVRRAPRLFAFGALALAAAAPAQGASVQLPAGAPVTVQVVGADSYCTGGFSVGGTAAAPTLTCQTGGSPAPLPVPVPAPAPAPIPGGGTGGGITCPGFANTQVLDIPWGNVSNFRTSGLGPSDALVVRFTTGPGNTAQWSKISGGEYGSTGAPRLAILSNAPCDFQIPTRLGPGSGASASTISVLFTVGANNGTHPALLPNTTYYMNLQTNVGLCGQSTNCDMFITLKP